MTSALRLCAAVLALGLAAAPRVEAQADFVPAAAYDPYDCNTLVLYDEAIRTELHSAGQDGLMARYGDMLSDAPFNEAAMADAEARLASLRGHQIAIAENIRQRDCRNRTAGGVGSGAAWTMNPARGYAFRQGQREAAPYKAPPPRAPGDRTVRALPKGPHVARPVAYSAAEVERFCQQGWETRPLSDGTVEYNPCFYK